MRVKGKVGSAKRWGDKESREKKTSKDLSKAFETCMMDGKVTIYSMAQYLDLKPDTVKRRLRADGGYWIDGEQIGRKEPGFRG